MTLALSNVQNAVTRFGGRSLLYVRKYAPEILTGAGIVGVVVSTVLTAKATLKLEEKTDAIEVHRTAVRDRADRDPAYAAHGYRADMVRVYRDGTWSIVQLYALPVGTGVASIGCILAAHGILRRRNAALGAALISVTEAYASYRERVKEKLGEDEELKLYYNERTIEVEGEDGTPMALTTIDTKHSPYARWFDEGSTHWSREPGQNFRTLLSEQSYFNDRLKVRGYVFLNEVYQRLGLPITREGQQVGWLYDPNNPDVPGVDDYIDFGIMDPDNPKARDFVNGWAKSILLDFNVQGPILNLLPANKQVR